MNIQKLERERERERWERNEWYYNGKRKKKKIEEHLVPCPHVSRQSEGV